MSDCLCISVVDTGFPRMGRQLPWVVSQPIILQNGENALKMKEFVLEAAAPIRNCIPMWQKKPGGCWYKLTPGNANFIHFSSLIFISKSI